MTGLGEAARLALGTAAALGLSRLAFGLLLPGMRDQLGWTLAQGGGLATFYGAGYLVGAVLTPWLVRKFGAGWVFRSGMVVTAVSLAGTAVSGDYLIASLVRATAGLSGAPVFIAGGVIATRMAAAHGTPAPIVIYFSGTGLGITVSGALLPLLLDGHTERWNVGWLILGGLSVLATLGSWSPAGRRGHTETATGGTQQPLRHLWRIGTAYLLFGAGYMSYMTFLDTFQLSHQIPVHLRAATWALLGMSVLVAPALWGRPMNRWPRARTLAALLAVVTLAAALPLLHPGWPAMIASAALFGTTLMVVPSSVTALIGTAVPPAARTTALATFTVLFALGQAVGPWLAGALADRTSTGATLAWTCATCALGSVLAASHRCARPPRSLAHDRAPARVTQGVTR